MTVVSVCGIYPLIQVIFTVIEFLRLRLPHELYVYLRVKRPTLRQLQLKKHKRAQKEYLTIYISTHDFIWSVNFVISNLIYFTPMLTWLSSSLYFAC